MIKIDKKELIFIGVIIIVVAAIAAFTAAPSNAKDTEISILGDGVVGDNGTVYIKLTNGEKAALSGKTLHVKITGKNDKVVYDNSIKTHATGVGIVKLKNMSSGDYKITVTFDGDANNTAKSVSQKLKVKSGYVQEDVDNSTLFTPAELAEIERTESDSASSDVSSSDSYSDSNSYSNSDSQSSDDTSSSSDEGDGGLIDENGNEVEEVIDEDGHVVNSPET